AWRRIARICASVYLLVFIQNLLVHLAEKILLMQPLTFGGDYPPPFCGFRALLILPDPYPTDLARGFRPFVDLLLTRSSDSKKPRWMAGRMWLITLRDFGCGGRI
ncbi:hypothetical protein, partial [Gemmobacter caeruleus]|uniref:hypothetical protein n=1 Tax=Gemmobacter caeruleus TaxID=2595004 RepID=UPI00193A259D